MDFTLGTIHIELAVGDITKQNDLDAVVNAANKDLKPGGGVAGEIHKAAGPELYEACKIHSPIAVGEAVITEGFQLPNRYVVHTLGPVYGKDLPEDELLKKCYLNSLKLAKDHDVKSIGFPAISTGIFGYPKEEAVKVLKKLLLDYSKEEDTVRQIRFVLYNNADYKLYQSVIGRIK